MRSPSPRLPAAIVALSLVGCSAAVPPAGASAEVATAPVATATVAPAASEPAPAPPSPPRSPEPEVLASESSPPGISKLSKEEGEFAHKACAPLSNALATAAKKEKLAGATDRNAFIQEFLRNPPRLAGVDVPKCADLLLRDMRGYLAAMIESEAKMSLGRVVVGLASALEKEPAELCPSAGPVPADLGALAAGPWASKAEDWTGRGWACSRFNLAGEPQRFQYEIVTNGKAGTWEVIARGFPLKGGAPTELYARGRIEGGHIQPSREVYRRALTR